jgi:hypothetical protein
VSKEKGYDILGLYREVRQMKNSRIGIKEQKTDGTLNNPRFILSLENKGIKPDEQIIDSSFEALAKLIGGSDAVLVVDTALLNLPYHQREPHVQKCLEDIRSLGLEYRCSKSASSQKRSMLGGLSGLLGQKPAQELEIMALIPHEMWTREDFKKTLPIYGARYFVANQNANGVNLLEEMQKMLDNEMLDYFKLILYSAVCYGTISISSKYLTLSELKMTFEI